MARLSVVACVVIFWGVVHGQQSAGDVCIVKTTGKPGECKFLANCPDAVQQLQEKKNPQTCGFDGTEPIVCCPNSSTRPLRNPGEVSKQKCKEYAKYARIKRDPPPLMPAFGGDEDTDCESVPLTTGYLPFEKQFPHLVIIEHGLTNNVTRLCGGTIISEQHILTAAHCLFHRELGPPKYVRMRTSRISDNTLHKINESIAHPAFNNTFYNDIAILKLESPLKLDSYTRPACLYTNFTINTSKAISTGWEFQDFTNSNDGGLDATVSNIVEKQICKDSYKNQISRRLTKGILDEKQICAHSEEKHICDVISGGPLQIHHVGDDLKCMHDIVGIFSFGKTCDSDSPHVFTRVSSYIKWIEDTVWPQ